MMIKPIKMLIAAAACTGLIASCVPSVAHVDRPPPAETPDRPSQIPAVKQDDTTPEQQPTAVSRPAVPDVLIEEEMRFADGLREASFDQIEDDRLIKRDPDLPEVPEIVIDRDKPTPGGKAKIYLYRGFLDDAVADMTRLNPFGGDGQNRKIFTVTDSTHRRMEFTLTGVIRRADGRRATALDFIELWSSLLKNRPAQGLALFRNVQGAENYINGKDPLVNGWSAADENTIRIRFAKPDPLGFHRMNSPKLIGGPFMMGAYYSGGTKDAQTRLLPNANSLSTPAFLTECTVQTGGDPNALASFSDGKYSAMTLYQLSDIETAKTELEAEGRASLRKLPSDRYFLACRTEDAEIRKFVRGAANGADLLDNHVKAEGESIASVSTHGENIEMPRSGIPPPALSKPFKIIYRDDDPVSKIVAEKLSADLNGTRMPAEAIPQDAGKYETALAKGQYDCAVGWVPETVLENRTEQLHLASMWFNDEMNPQTRLREYREIPLFSVNNYLLMRNDIRLHEDRVSGMWQNVNASGEY